MLLVTAYVIRDYSSLLFSYLCPCDISLQICITDIVHYANSIISKTRLLLDIFYY